MNNVAAVDTRGLVTHIQRFSLDDGPGIRTTVFLKGCQMRCAWCHNPEGLNAEPELQVVAERCIGCGVCLERCRQGAHELVDGRRRFLHRRCIACGRCAETCYTDALIFVGETKSTREVVEEVIADRDFYRSSGGGVTLSGGEPLVQPDFVAAVLKLCKTEGIHTAVETNLAWPWERLQAVLPLIDLLLVDVKIFNDREHRRWTGASNKDTLANLRRLRNMQKPTIVRTPVIGGLNDRVDHIGAIARFLASSCNVLEYELLPYHPLGLGKYASFGLEPPADEFHEPSAARMEQLARVARDAGLAVRVAGPGDTRKATEAIST